MGYFYEFTNNLGLRMFMTLTNPHNVGMVTHHANGVCLIPTRSKAKRKFLIDDDEMSAEADKENWLGLFNEEQSDDKPI